MTHYRDVYAAIACRLYDDPIALLRLAMVCRAANQAMTSMFPALCVEWAVVERQTNVNKHTQYLRLIPYASMTPELSGAEYQTTYILRWGGLHIQMIIHSVNVRILIYNDEMVMQDFQVKHPTGAVTRIYLARMEAAMSAARFVARVFPGAYEAASCRST